MKLPTSTDPLTYSCSNTTGVKHASAQDSSSLVDDFGLTLMLQPATLVVAELCLTRLLRFKAFDTRYTVYTKQRDPRRPWLLHTIQWYNPRCQPEKHHIYEWKKPKLLRCRRLNRSIHASIRSHSPTDHHRRPARKRSVSIKQGAVRLGLKQRRHLMREQSGIIWN